MTGQGLLKSFASAGAFLLIFAPVRAAEAPLCPPVVEAFAEPPVRWGSNDQAESFNHPHGWRYVLARAPDIAGAWDALAPADQRRIIKSAAALADDRRLEVLSDAVVYTLYLSSNATGRLSIWAGPEFAFEDYLAKKPFVPGSAAWDEAGARRLHDSWKDPAQARPEDRPGLAERVRRFPLLEEREADFDRLWWNAVSTGIVGAETGARLLAELGAARPVFMLRSAQSTFAEHTDGGLLIGLQAGELRAEMVLQRPEAVWSYESAELRDQLASDYHGLKLPPGWAMLSAHELVHYCVGRGFPVASLRTNAVLTRGTRLEERYAQAVSLRIQMELLTGDPDALDPATPFAILLRRSLKEFLIDDQAYFARLQRNLDDAAVRKNYLEALGTGLSAEQRRSRDLGLKLLDGRRAFLERGLLAQREWVKRHGWEARVALLGAEAEQIRGPDAGFFLLNKLDELLKLAGRVPQGSSARRLLDRTALKVSRRFVAETRRNLDDPEWADHVVKWVMPFQNILGRAGVAEPRALTELSAQVYSAEPPAPETP